MMEPLCDFKELATLLRPFSSPPHDSLSSLSPDDQINLLSAAQAGQYHLAEQILFDLEQIRTSIELNDGTFCHLIEELEKSLKYLMENFSEGQNAP